MTLAAAGFGAGAGEAVLGLVVEGAVVVVVVEAGVVAVESDADAAAGSANPARATTIAPVALVGTLNIKEN